jgi:hypothetical protein
MTRDERIKAVSRLGYSALDASFLVTAALHSGYFLQRQFVQFVGPRSRHLLRGFIENVLSLRHARISSFNGPTKIYHLAAKPLYTALGEPDARYRRRPRHALGIKSRLMGLDYILGRPDLEFLATERDRIVFFAGCGIETARMPQLRYQRHRPGAMKTHYFVDRFPIGLTKPCDGTDAEPVFAYIDEGAVSVRGFESYLAKYEPLFRVLPRWQLTFVSDSSRLCTSAGRVFLRWRAARCSTSGQSSHGGDGARVSDTGAPVEDVLAYFRLRHAYETKHYAALTKERLDQLRTWRKTFAAPLIEALFSPWQQEGDDIVLASATTAACAIEQSDPRFDTYVLPHAYTPFGAPRLGSRRVLH